MPHRLLSSLLLADCCHAPVSPAAKAALLLREAQVSAGAPQSTLGTQPRASTPSTADATFCSKVPTYFKGSSRLKSKDSCESGKDLERHYMLKRKSEE